MFQRSARQEVAAIAQQDPLQVDTSFVSHDKCLAQAATTCQNTKLQVSLQAANGFSMGRQTAKGCKQSERHRTAAVAQHNTLQCRMKAFWVVDQHDVLGLQHLEGQTA